MDDIMDLIGPPHAPIPADFRSPEHHVVGNQTRLGGAGEIREDLSWQWFLTAYGLATVTRISGSTNRRFGYEWPE